MLARSVNPIVTVWEAIMGKWSGHYGEVERACAKSEGFYYQYGSARQYTVY